MGLLLLLSSSCPNGAQQPVVVFDAAPAPIPSYPHLAPHCRRGPAVAHPQQRLAVAAAGRPSAAAHLEEPVSMEEELEDGGGKRPWRMAAATRRESVERKELDREPMVLGGRRCCRSIPDKAGGVESGDGTGNSSLSSSSRRRARGDHLDPNNVQLGTWMLLEHGQFFIRYKGLIGSLACCWYINVDFPVINSFCGSGVNFGRHPLAMAESATSRTLWPRRPGGANCPAPTLTPEPDTVPPDSAPSFPS